MADFADRSLGIGYTGGSTLLLTCLVLVARPLVLVPREPSRWTPSARRGRSFYWAAITFSQTLGTALGDWIADTGGLGYRGGALVFARGARRRCGALFLDPVSRVRCSGRRSS